MRRHAKAPSAGSGSATRRGHRKTAAFIAVFALVLGVGLGAATALAGTAPTVTIGAPGAVSYTSAHFSGTVNPNGGPGPIEMYGEHKPVGGGGWTYSLFRTISGAEAEGTDPIAVEGDITGLQPGTEYEVRLDAYAGGVETYSPEPNPTLATKVVPAPTVTMSAPSPTPYAATVEGQVTAPAGADPAFLTSWEFVCAPACSYKSGTPHTGTTQPGQIEVVKAYVDLEPGMTYEVSLIAHNAGGQVSAGPEVFAAPTGAPLVISTSGGSSGRTEAALWGSLRAGGLATTYHFEYGTGSAYGGVTPEKAIAAGGNPVNVSATVSGLTPGTAYHYRLVASNSQGTTEGPDRTLVTGTGGAADSCPNAAVRAQQSAGYLPNCRAYEQVSPGNKAGADVNGDAVSGGSSGEVLAAPSGAAAAYSSFGAFANAPSGGWPSWYRAVRGATGWSSSALTPASVAGGTPPANTPAVTALTSDLSKAIVTTNAPLTPNAPPGVYNLFLQDNNSGAHSLVTNVGPPESLLPPPALEIGASDDLSHVFFLSEANLTPEATGFGWKLYESVNGVTRLAGIGPAPANEPLSGVFPSANRSSDRMVSADGSRVYFIGPDQILYMREGGTTTRRVSPEDSVQDRFFTATPDGSSVLYEMRTEEPNGGQKLTLVQTDVETGVTEAVSTEGAFSNVLKASDNLRYVYYFTGSPGKAATIWLWHDGSHTQVAELDPNDQLLGLSERTPYGSAASSISPDGQTLLFVSSSKLTAYDNEGHSEIYRYRPVTGVLDCISCSPSGAPPRGDASLVDWFFRSTSNLPPTSIWNGPEPWRRWRNISSDQQRIFFNSTESLVPSDVNGKSDVYMWEDGRLSLISSGTGGNGSRFMNASANGDDVFFVTRDRLVPGDRDGLVDVYDARVDGGFLEPESPALCKSEICQQPSAAPASTPVAGSASLTAASKQRASRPRVTASRSGKAAGPRATVKVHASQPGTVILTGQGIRRVVKRAPAAATYRLDAVLTPAAKSTLAKRGSLKARVQIKFEAGSGDSARTRLTLTFRRKEGR